MTTLRAVDLIARVAGVPLRHVVKVLLASELSIDYLEVMGQEVDKSYDPSPPTDEQKSIAFEEYNDLKAHLESCGMEDRLEEIRKL